MVVENTWFGPGNIKGGLNSLMTLAAWPCGSIVMMLSLMELLPVPVYNLCLAVAWDLAHLEVIAR